MLKKTLFFSLYTFCCSSLYCSMETTKKMLAPRIHSATFNFARRCLGKALQEVYECHKGSTSSVYVDPSLNWHGDPIPSVIYNKPLAFIAMPIPLRPGNTIEWAPKIQYPWFFAILLQTHSISKLTTASGSTKTLHCVQPSHDNMQIQLKTSFPDAYYANNSTPLPFNTNIPFYTNEEIDAKLSRVKLCLFLLVGMIYLRSCKISSKGMFTSV